MPSVVQRYLDIRRGAVVITGNTIGLDKISCFLRPGNSGSQGAYISTTDLSIATGWNAQGALDTTVGITRDSRKIGSRAKLYIPINATILYAELVWFATATGVSNRDAAIKFITPLTPSNGVQISGDSATKSTVAMPNYNVYVRSAEVTDKIKTGEQTYEARNVPAKLYAYENEETAGGWCLLVAYEDSNESFKNLSIYVLGIGVRNDVSNKAVSINIPNVITPGEGTVKGRAVIAAGEGDVKYTNDYVKFGANSSNQVKLSGPNNPQNNFFTSAVNIGDYNPAYPPGTIGTVDTRGSMGNNNHNAANTTLGARHGIDITNVDISAGLQNNQTSALMTFDTDDDNYVPVAFGFQIEVVPSIKKTVNKSYADLGEELEYTITIKNPGTALPWTSVYFQDDIPSYTTFIQGSVTFPNAPNPNTLNPAEGFLVSNSLSANQSIVIKYKVIVTSLPPLPEHRVVNSNAKATYKVGGKTETLLCDSVYTIINKAILSISKDSIPNGPVSSGQEIAYSIKISNTGTTAGVITSGNFVDYIPNGTNFLANSISPNNIGFSYDSVSNSIKNTSNITVAANSEISFTFKVTIK